MLPSQTKRLRRQSRLGLELIGQPVADRAGGPVGGDDQIGGGKAAVGEVPDLPLPLHLDPERLRPPGEQLQQGLPLHAGEAMPRRPHDGAAVVDLDILPARRGGGHRLVGLGIGLADVLEGLVGEHHPEAERVLDPVPLVDRHLVARVVALEQDGEIEAGGPGPHDRDVSPGGRLPRRGHQPAAAVGGARRIVPLDVEVVPELAGHRLVHLVEALAVVGEDAAPHLVRPGPA